MPHSCAHPVVWTPRACTARHSVSTPACAVKPYPATDGYTPNTDEVAYVEKGHIPERSPEGRHDIMAKKVFVVTRKAPTGVAVEGPCEWDADTQCVTSPNFDQDAPAPDSLAPVGLPSTAIHECTLWNLPKTPMKFSMFELSAADPDTQGFGGCHAEKLEVTIDNVVNYYCGSDASALSGKVISGVDTRFWGWNIGRGFRMCFKHDDSRMA